MLYSLAFAPGCYNTASIPVTLPALNSSSERFGSAASRSPFPLQRDSWRYLAGKRRPQALSTELRFDLHKGDTCISSEPSDCDPRGRDGAQACSPATSPSAGEARFIRHGPPASDDGKGASEAASISSGGGRCHDGGVRSALLLLPMRPGAPSHRGGAEAAFGSRAAGATAEEESLGGEHEAQNRPLEAGSRRLSRRRRFQSLPWGPSGKVQLQ